MAGYTWSAALSLASGEWRLPNINELRSIVERRNRDPVINATVFPNTPANYFWSASPYGFGSAWYVLFDYGDDNAEVSGDDSLAVRLVRGGQGLAGDVNGDGSVNALDVVAVINAVLGIQPLSTADVNSDGAVNALDAVFVINKVLGL